jgi:hypothetical protein
MRSTPASAFAALALTLLALALRWDRGADWWYNPDEAIFWSVAHSASLAEMHEFLITGTEHPPAFFYLLHGLVQLRDDLDWLRLPALLAGTLLVPLAFYWCRALAGPPAGFVAGLVLALSPPLVEQSALVRPYTIQVLALLCALLALERHRAGRRLLALVVYSAATTLAILLHYGSIVALAPIAVLLAGWWLRGELDRRSLLALGIAQLPVLAVLGWVFSVHLLPFVLGGVLEASVRELWLPEQYASGPLDGLRLLSMRLASVVGAGLRNPLPAGLFALGLLLAGLRRRWDVVLLSTCAALAAIALSWAGLYPLGHTRHSLYLVPFVVLALATGVGSLLGQRSVAARALGALLLATLCLQQVGALARSFALIERRGSGERVVSREVAREVSGRLAQASAEGGLVLTDDQSFRLLQPALGIENREVAPVPGAQELRLARWRGLEFVYPRGWMVVGTRAERESEFHLEHVLDALERDPHFAARLKEGPVWLVQGGWQVPFVLEVPPREPSGRMIWGGAAGGHRLLLVRFHPDAYRAYLVGGPGAPEPRRGAPLL